VSAHIRDLRSLSLDEAGSLALRAVRYVRWGYITEDRAAQIERNLMAAGQPDAATIVRNARLHVRQKDDETNSRQHTGART
jgi:hypothetical protein